MAKEFMANKGRSHAELYSEAQEKQQKVGEAVEKRAAARESLKSLKATAELRAKHAGAEA